MSTVTLASSVYSSLYPVKTPNLDEKSSSKNFFHIASDYVKKTEGAKTVADFISTVTAWPNLLSKNSTKVFNKVSHSTGEVRNFLSIVQTPKAAKDFVHSITKKDKFTTQLVKGSSLVNNVVDGIDFCNRKFFKLDPLTQRSIGVVNNVATVVGSTVGAGREIKQIAKNDSPNTKREGHRLYHSMIELAKYVSYAAFGALGLAAAFFSVLTSAWIPLACLTCGVSFTILGHFYKKMNSL